MLSKFNMQLFPLTYVNEKNNFVAKKLRASVHEVFHSDRKNVFRIILEILVKILIQIQD